METEFRPQARPLEPIPVEVEGRQLIVLRDPLRFSDEVVVTPFLYFFLAHCDGQRTLADVKLIFFRQFQHILTEDETNVMLAEMDRHFLLDNDRFREHRAKVLDEYRRQTVRPASHQGQAYPEDPDVLRAELDSYFHELDGSKPAAGAPGASGNGAPLTAFIAPHISVKQGAACFAAAYRRLRESPPVETVVILGTGHAPIEGYFAVTRKSFVTPFGMLDTDTDFIDRLERHFGGDLCQQEIHHRGEHVIEFQIIFLQHALAGRACRIVPVLCSYGPEDVIESGRPGRAAEVVNRFSDALRKTIAETTAPVCVVSSADLAHIGFRYGDPVILGRPELDRLEREDRQMIEIICAGDADGFLRNLLVDQNRRRICGFPCIYAMLRALDLKDGELLRYGQSSMDERESTVSYVSVAFHA